MSLTLIQLISEETMQNLLPVLAFRPARLLHLITERVKERSAPIGLAARQAEVPVTPEPINLPAMPSIRETFAIARDVIRKAKASGNDVVVNFTGGTKLMSIGAFSAALQEEVASVYVDTENGRFLDGGAKIHISQFLGDNLALTSFQDALRVSSVALANGCSRATKGRDWRPYTRLAEHFLAHPEDETVCHELFEKLSRFNGQRTTKADWEKAAQEPLRVPPPVAQLALEAALLERNADGLFLLPGGLSSRSGFEFIVAFFTGAWWEVAVARAVDQSGLFRDLHWSADYGVSGLYGGDLEEDIVALDGVQIAYFSCKRSGIGEKPIAHLEEIDARARRIGGRFARKFFAVYRPIQPSIEHPLRVRAASLGIQILGPADLTQPASLAKK